MATYPANLVIQLARSSFPFAPALVGLFCVNATI